MNTVEGIKVAEDITFRESQSDALSDVGRTHSSNESQTNDKPNLCRRVQGATVRGENFTQRRGSRRHSSGRKPQPPAIEYLFESFRQENGRLWLFAAQIRR